jgi:hypothetical protein
MKIQRPGISNKSKIAQSQEEQPIEPVKILEITHSQGNVCLRVAMSFEFYNELHTFLEHQGWMSWGHNEKEGIALLLEFGLSEESREELERNKEELLKVSSRYAALNFQTSEYYANNSAIAMGLRLHLQENKSLKKKLEKRGLGGYVSEDEWDKWDDNYINELYRIYVFCR